MTKPPDTTLTKGLPVKTTLLLAASLTVMSNAIIAPALPSISAAYPEASDVAIQLIVTLPALAIAGLAPVSGFLIDRFGRIRLLTLCTAAFAVAGSAGLYLDGVPALLASRFALGLAVAGLMTTSTTLVGDYFQGDQRQSFMGLQSAFMAFGGLVFVTAGGALAGLGWRYPFAIYGVALILLPMVLLILSEPQRGGIGLPSDPDAPPTYRRLTPRCLLTIGFVYLIGLLGMAVFYLVPVQVPYLIQEQHGGSELAGGLAIGVTTLTSGLTALRYRSIHRRLGNWGVLALTYGTIAAGYLGVAVAPNTPLVFASLALAGIGCGLIMPQANLWLLAVAPERLRGRLVGGLTSAIFVGQFLSPVLVQPLVTLTDRPTAFTLTAAFTGTLALAFLTVKIISSRQTD